MDVQMLLRMMLVLFGSIVEGTLVQVTGNTIICPDDAAVFWCSNTILNWEVRTRSGLSWLGFVASDSNIGTSMNGTLNSSLIVVQVTYNNNSVLNATLTIRTPINLNGSTITCYRDSLTLNIHEATINNSLPTSINITKNICNESLLIYWEVSGLGYCIQHSTQTSLSTTWTKLTDSFYFLPLINDIYRISISNEPNLNMVSNFNLGTCIFNDLQESRRTYILNLNDTWTIIQECNDNIALLFDTKCALNGSWTTDIRCRDIEESTSINMATATYFKTTTREDNTTFVCSKMYSTLDIIFAVMGTFIITLITSFSIGLCGHFLNKKVNRRISNIDVNIAKEKPTSLVTGPLYEEVKLQDEVKCISTSKNVAYISVNEAKEEQ